MMREFDLYAQRKLVPKPAVQLAAGLLLVHTTPLLEEERDAPCNAAVTDNANPLQFHWATARAGLAANNHPVDP